MAKSRTLENSPYDPVDRINDCVLEKFEKLDRYRESYGDNEIILQVENMFIFTKEWPLDNFVNLILEEDRRRNSYVIINKPRSTISNSVLRVLKSNEEFDTKLRVISDYTQNPENAHRGLYHSIKFAEKKIFQILDEINKLLDDSPEIRIGLKT